MSALRSLLCVAAVAVMPTTVLHAWDYAGHRIVNQLALAGLPEDFPAFVRTPAAVERIAFLAGEADRWRNNPDLPIKHCNGLDHYIDLEQLDHAGLDRSSLSPLRYEFAVAFAQGRADHHDHFPAIDPARNADHTREWCGFLPWAITEYYGKLRSAFSYLKVLRELGTPEEVAQAEANIVYIMGVMGHYVGDGAQPLHLSVHHNGWGGENPNGYTTSSRIHSYIDGGFIEEAGITVEELTPRARRPGPLFVGEAAVFAPRDPMFDAVMSYLGTQAERVEPLYALEKAGQLKGSDAESSAEGRVFIEEQLLRGGEMLAAVWVTAWRNTGPDKFLEGQLQKRAEKNPATP